MTGLVSVILPVFNGALFLRETLGSILSQAYQPLEIVVVDDGSADGSLEILSEFSQCIILLHQPNVGIASARNHGLAAAKGDYIAFLDHDDLWAPDKTQAQVAFLESHPHCDYVLGRQRFFLHPDTERPSWLKPGLLNGDYAAYNLGAMLARRRVFDRVGLLDANYRYADDVAWFFNAKDRQVPMSHMTQTVLHKRIHGSNASRHLQQIHQELLSVARKSIAQQREPKP